MAATTPPTPTIEYVFSNGVSFTGSADQLLQYATLVGESINPARLGGIIPRGYYYSTAHGLMEISKMDTVHLVNALNKRTVDYYNNIRPKTKDFDLSQYLKDYVSLTESPEVEEMFTELSGRKK